MTVVENVCLAVFWGCVALVALCLRLSFPPRRPVCASDRLPLRAVRFQATDGLWLSGWRLSAKPSHPWVILCHRLGGDRSELLDLAGALLEAGYNSFLFDFRAHGQSRGRVTSFGLHEQRDLEGALAFLGKQPDVPEWPLGILGRDLGADVALAVAARDERLAVVVLDSPNASAVDLAAEQLRVAGIPLIIGRLLAAVLYRLRFSRSLSRSTVRRYADALDARPTLLIHGHRDQGTHLLMSDAAERCGIQAAPHTPVHTVNPEAYHRQIVEFFDRHLTARLRSICRSAE